MGTNKVCKYCLCEVERNATFCQNCGAKMFKEKQVATPQPATQPTPAPVRSSGYGYTAPVSHQTRNRTIGALVAVAVFVLIVVIIAVSSCSPSPLKAFKKAAIAAGYYVEEDENYDGYNTHWVGAHKFKDGTIDGKPTDEECLFIIDLTRDTSESNADVEYRNYVRYLTEKIPDSTPQTSSGVGYKYQISQNETHFGIAYRTGVFNILVMGRINEKDEPVAGAPIEYRLEILTFLTNLGYSLPKL